MGSESLSWIPAGRLADRIGTRGPVLVLAAGVAMLGLAYTGFGLAGASIAVLAAVHRGRHRFGAVEAAEHAAVAPETMRGSAFGLRATIQVLGNVAASAVAGVLWTAVSPGAALAAVSGACSPASSHTRARAAARAVLIAANTRGASLARASMVRETVGSEATRAEHARLGAQQRDVGQAVPAECQRNGQIGEHLGRIVHGERLAPARQPGR